MIVSKILYENLIKISEQIRFEKNLAIDLININGVEGLFISKNNIDIDILKFIKKYFGEVKGFENTNVFQSMSVGGNSKKLEVKKSYEMQDVMNFLEIGLAVLVIEGIPQIYGIGIDNNAGVKANIYY